MTPCTCDEGFVEYDRSYGDYTKAIRTECPECEGTGVLPDRTLRNVEDDLRPHGLALVAAINKAAHAFAVIRDDLHKRLKGEEFRDAMAPHERTCDEAHAAAHAAYDEATAELRAEYTRLHNTLRGAT